MTDDQTKSDQEAAEKYALEKYPVHPFDDDDDLRALSLARRAFQIGYLDALAHERARTQRLEQLLVEAVERLRWYDAEHEPDFYGRVDEALKEGGGETSDVGLVGNIDAHAWASTFLRQFEGHVIGTNDTVDFDTLRSWFANAIMSGYDRKETKLQTAVTALEEMIDQGIDTSTTGGMNFVRDTLAKIKETK